MRDKEHTEITEDTEKNRDRFFSVSSVPSVNYVSEFELDPNSYSGAPAASSALLIFAIVRRSGVCLPFSSRLSVSTRMPALRASAACERPTALRAAMIFRAIIARIAPAAGYTPSDEGIGNRGLSATVRPVSL